MKKLILFLTIFINLFSLTAQTHITYNGSGNYILIEKTDLRRYDNGKYTGLESREISSYICPVSYENGYLYEGDFYYWLNIQRNSLSLTGEIQNTIPSKFKIDNEGHFTMLVDNGFPSFRSFPSFTDKEIHIGDKWQAKAERAVDPLNNGKITKMPIYVEYQYLKDEVYAGEECYLLSAQWATRYGIGNGSYNRDWGGDKNLEKATGSHKATIYVSKETGNALVIRDYVDETFFYVDGSTLQYKGTISQFTQYPPAVDHSKLLPALKRIASISPELEEEIKNKDKKQSGFDGNSGENAEKNVNSLEKLENTSKNLANSSENSLLDSQINEQKTIKIDENNPQIAKNDLSSSQFSTKNEENLLNQVENSLNKNIITQNSSESVKNTQNNQNTKTEPISVESTEIGIKLTINDLQFKPDSSELLANEKTRLDQIAEVLKQVPQSQLLVEGHTASTGNERGEMNLSLERAHAIADALIKRGIDSKRIICKGSGGKKPVANNSTPQGKARNRRVEITILE